MGRPSFDEDTQVALIKAVETWLLVRNQWRDQGKLTGLSQLAADVAHSALLRRLLSGKEPLPLPPPRAYSYPNYDLGEGKKVYLFGEVPTSVQQDGKPLRKIIMQSLYTVREDGLLEWEETGEIFELIEGDFHLEEAHDCSTRACKTRWAIQKVLKV